MSMDKCMIAQRNDVLKKYLKAVIEFAISPIPQAFWNGEINQWAVPLSEKQRLLFTFFADKNNNTKNNKLIKNDTKSIEISLENKDIDNSFIPTLSTAHKFSDSVIESDAISHCLEDFCKKI